MKKLHFFEQKLNVVCLNQNQQLSVKGGDDKRTPPPTAPGSGTHSGSANF